MEHSQCARNWHLGSINISLLWMVSGSVHMIRIKFEIMTATRTIRYLFSQNRSLQNQRQWCIQNSLPLLSLRCSTSSLTSLQWNSNSKSNSMRHKHIKTQLKTYHSSNGNSLSLFNNNNRSSSNNSLLENDRRRTAKSLEHWADAEMNH